MLIFQDQTFKFNWVGNAQFQLNISGEAHFSNFVGQAQFQTRIRR